MLRISYKATYNLLEGFYQRRSLNQIIVTDTPENIFEASKVTAMALEDYNYLDSMVTKREDLDKSYALFIDGNNCEHYPIVLIKNKDLTLLEFSKLSVMCKEIDEQHFKDVIEAQSESDGHDAKSCINAFTLIKTTIFNSKKETKTEAE